MFREYSRSNILIGCLSLFSLRYSGGLKRFTKFQDLLFGFPQISYRVFVQYYQQPGWLHYFKYDSTFIKDYIGKATIYVPVMPLSIILLILIAVAAATIYFKKYHRQGQAQVDNEQDTLANMVEICWTLTLVDSLLKCTLECSSQLVVGIPLLLLLYSLFGSNPNRKEVLKTIGIAAAIVLLSFSLSQHDPENKAREDFEVGWAEYEVNCHHPAWKFRSVAETQMRCQRTYFGRPVNWTGKLSYVKLKETAGDNGAGGGWMMGGQDPEIELEMVMNAAGGRELEEFSRDHVDWKWGDLLPAIWQKDSVDFSIGRVMMVISSEDTGSTDPSSLISYIHSFRTGDEIQFHGILIRGLGGFKPEIRKVVNLTCISCAEMKNNGITFHLKNKENGKNSWIWMWDQTPFNALNYSNFQHYIQKLW